MKNFYLSALLGIFILMFTGCTDETHLSTSAIIFTRPECSNTEKAIQFFKTLQNKSNIVTYQVKDLSNAENRLLLRKFANKHHINLKQLYTPIIFTPKGYSSGWNEKTAENLKLLLNIR